MVKGMTISSILPVAGYISCRETGTPKIREDANITPEELTKSHTMLYLELGFEILIIDTMKRIAKMANKVNLSAEQGI
jgi:transcription initiation factor TFIIIB Brf1 subunit/transcription initiation factor TFIIB